MRGKNTKFGFAKDLEARLNNLDFKIARINNYLDSDEFLEDVANILLSIPEVIDEIIKGIEQMILNDADFKNMLEEAIKNMLEEDKEFLNKIIELLLANEGFLKKVEEVIKDMLLNDDSFKEVLEKAIAEMLEQDDRFKNILEEALKNMLENDPKFIQDMVDKLVINEILLEGLKNKLINDNDFINKLFELLKIKDANVETIERVENDKRFISFTFSWNYSNDEVIKATTKEIELIKGEKGDTGLPTQEQVNEALKNSDTLMLNEEDFFVDEETQEIRVNWQENDNLDPNWTKEGIAKRQLLSPFNPKNDIDIVNKNYVDEKNQDILEEAKFYTDEKISDIDAPDLTDYEKKIDHKNDIDELELRTIGLIGDKQNKLIAGANITIENDVISASGSGETGDATFRTGENVSDIGLILGEGETNNNLAGTKYVADAVAKIADALGNYETKETHNEDIQGLQEQIDNLETGEVDLTDYYKKGETDTLLDKKQDNLIAGANIQIDENNVISATGEGEAPDLGNYYTKPETDTLLDEKANKTDLKDWELKSDHNVDITRLDAKDTEQDNRLSDLNTDKQDKLVSGRDIKTINGEDLLGEGNIEIQGGSGDSNFDVNLENTDSTVSYKNNPHNFTDNTLANVKYVNDSIAEIDTGGIFKTGEKVSELSVAQSGTGEENPILITESRAWQLDLGIQESAKKYTDDEIAKIETPDLDNYYTKQQTDSLLIGKADRDDLDGFASETYVRQQTSQTLQQANDYTDEKISEIGGDSLWEISGNDLITIANRGINIGQGVVTNVNSNSNTAIANVKFVKDEIAKGGGNSNFDTLLQNRVDGDIVDYKKTPFNSLVQPNSVIWKGHLDTQLETKINKGGLKTINGQSLEGTGNIEIQGKSKWIEQTNKTWFTNDTGKEMVLVLDNPNWNSFRISGNQTIMAGGNRSYWISGLNLGNETEVWGLNNNTTHLKFEEGFLKIYSTVSNITVASFAENARVWFTTIDNLEQTITVENVEGLSMDAEIE